MTPTELAQKRHVDAADEIMQRTGCTRAKALSLAMMRPDVREMAEAAALHHRNEADFASIRAGLDAKQLLADAREYQQSHPGMTLTACMSKLAAERQRAAAQPRRKPATQPKPGPLPATVRDALPGVADGLPANPTRTLVRPRAVSIGAGNGELRRLFTPRALCT